MILILIPHTTLINQVINTVMETFYQVKQPFVLAAVPDISLVYGNRRRVEVYHEKHGTLVPDVVFHWVGARDARSMLDALHLAGYRLINPVEAWRIGRNKALQLAVFEKNEIPHPWSFFTYGGWSVAGDQVPWSGKEYVLKPHNASRGRYVHKTADRNTAKRLYSATPRYASGMLLQEYLDHAPKPRHHWRINVVGGRPVRGTQFFAAEGNWISNRAQGGHRLAEPDLALVPEKALQLAVRATSAVGADYSGVDVIEGSDGRFYVLETNELPEFGPRTAGHLARHIMEVARCRREGLPEG